MTLALTLILFAFVLTQVTGFVSSLYAASAPQEGVYATSYALEIWLPRLIYPLLALFFLTRLDWRALFTNGVFNIPMAGAWVVLALQVGSNTVSFAVFAALFFVAFIVQWVPTHGVVTREGVVLGVVYFLLVYLVLPLVLLFVFNLIQVSGYLPKELLFFIDGNGNYGLFRGQSFRGFARDRIAYSYLCGMTILSLLTVRGLSFVWLGVLLVALALAGSRAVLIALAFAMSSIFVSRRVALLFLAIGLVVVVIAAAFSGRPDFFGDPGDRVNIFLEYWGFLCKNPTVFLVGEGRFGVGVAFDGFNQVRAHNWLLNSIVNFGVPVTFAWMFFLYKFSKKLDVAGRSVIIYFLTVGFFHNGFDSYFFSMEQFLGLLLAMTLDKSVALPFLPRARGAVSRSIRVYR